MRRKRRDWRVVDRRQEDGRTLGLDHRLDDHFDYYRNNYVDYHGFDYFDHDW